MQPLRIDFELIGHMAVPDGPPPLLDGLLLALHCQGQQLPSIEPATLPLAHIAAASTPWHWLASAICIEFCGPSQARFLHRNPRPADALAFAHEHSASRVYLDRGVTRTVQTRILTRQATSARAWCIGQPEPLQALLERLTHLGSLRHLGLGQVRSAHIHPDPQALQNAWLRPISAPLHGDPYASERIALQGPSTPPYWRKTPATALWPTQALDWA